MIQSMDDERRIFSELVENYQKKVFQVAVGMLGNKDEALDITQDVFVLSLIHISEPTRPY